MSKRHPKPRRAEFVVIGDPAITPAEAAAGCAFIGTRWLPNDQFETLSSLYLKLELISKTQETQE